MQPGALPARCLTRLRRPSPAAIEGIWTMKRELVWLLTGALAVGAAVLGYLYWQETQRTGIDISVGGSGIRIEER
jgi:hypothetical protein